PTDIYPLSLHDALPICAIMRRSPTSLRPTLTAGRRPSAPASTPQSFRERVEALWSARDKLALRGLRSDTRQSFRAQVVDELEEIDRKSTRLNSSHVAIS